MLLDGVLLVVAVANILFK